MRTLSWIRYMTLGMAFLALASWAAALASQGTTPPARGVRCPPEFVAVWDPTTKVLRCRKDVVSWVVTACVDKTFATYVVKAGEDSCGPTEIPGVGKPPGARGAKAVSCAAPGYDLMTDRTGERDRCEKVERVFALPQPAS